MSVIYNPDYFFCKNLDDAKKVILGIYGGLDAEERWKLETEWLIEHIKFDNDQDLIVDYGCGIGRLSKEIKNHILGIDFSQSMRLQAEVYVGKDSFSVITPEILQVLFDNGLKVSGAIAVWTLQHVVDVEETIIRLMKGMKSGGIFWLLDANERLIPCLLADKPMPTYDDKFVSTHIYDDGKETYSLVDKWCELERVELMPIYSEKKVELRKYRRR